ncbi:hypothetical protein OGAPHI_005330 [Ogataea philodendri]|uniref:Uncharacterized protein n=1 Tax=Ogataea philodendri TaxID=1378263 RepID=A0A9P8P1D5_9ASCO|nr:uncharacterized protein OGAPHI_005330 [Ogataea philodendri]KAH3663340.1 hypothetical protein OGAPHI_005330 [Ogataea philodendri]
MAVPPPHYDTVLLREHLFQDLNNKYLVIPPEAHQPGFRPVHEIGLGLFNYYLVDQHSIQGAGYHGIAEIVLDLCLLFVFAVGFYAIYKLVILRRAVPKPVQLTKYYPQDLESQVQYSPDLPSLVHTPSTPSYPDSAPSSANTSPITNILEFDNPFKHSHNSRALMNSLKIQ